MDGFDNNETVETVESVETIDNNAGSYDSAYETTYETQDENGGSKVFGIISLICGILSIICCCLSWIALILGVAAVVLGIISIKKQEDAKGLAIAGIVCGGVGIVIFIVVLIIGLAGGEALNSLDPDSINEYVEQLQNL